MQNGSSVKKPRTSPARQSPCKRLRKCGCTTAHLGPVRLPLKALQLGLSLTAFVLQTVLEDCADSWGLQVFAFVSSSACLLCLLILAVYCTSLYEKIEKDQLKNLDFWFVTLEGVSFPVTSFLLFQTCDRESDDSAAVVLGLLAGVAFFVDAVMMCGKCLHARIKKARKHKIQQESTKGPLNPPKKQQLLINEPV